jgi:hypothetical protein
MMADGATREMMEQLKSPDYYPLPENSFGILRQMNDTTMVSSVCDGDSEHGFNVKVPPLKCVVIAVGSEKRYGVHD